MDTNTSPQLRKYVSVACNKCREAHRCCDGEIPCRRCRSRNLQCVYEKSRDKPRRIINKNLQYIYIQDGTSEADVTPQATASPSSLNLPPMDVNIYLNYYALEFNKTAHNSLTLPVYCQLLPQSLPLSLANISDDQKFRVCATLGLTALTLGHVQQGHVLMNHTKQYLPDALTTCTLDAAIGFIGLASCYMMEFQLTPTINYLKLSKSVTSTLWKMQQNDHNKSIIDATHTAPVIIHSITRRLQLNLTSFNSEGNLPEAVKGVQKQLDKLQDVVQKSQIPFSDVINLASGLFSLYTGDVSGVFQAIQNIELAARNLSYKWKEHSSIFVHLVRSLKFALLQDDLAMRNECGLLLQVFDQLTVHNCTSLSAMYSTALLWTTLGLENELQLLVLIAQRMSFLFPGGKFIVERFSKQSENGCDILKWNPFTELISKFRAMNNNTEQTYQPATPSILYQEPDELGSSPKFAFDQLDIDTVNNNFDSFF